LKDARVDRLFEKRSRQGDLHRVQVVYPR
jgi:hypothetical protein